MVVAFFELDIVCAEQYVNTLGHSWGDLQLLKSSHNLHGVSLKSTQTIEMEILLVEMMRKFFFFPQFIFIGNACNCVRPLEILSSSTSKD